ncbi:Amastin surface glycoprotein [Novymonas esmeraldas]|uniref:Amastin surface glycoprotein n=1 Tax=Novymonas esmeraldas TaxID=1808958 RepID=A0AAW0ERX2_9TRYP
MAQEASKKKAGVSPRTMTVCIVIVVLQFIGLFFMAIGSPYDVLKLNDATSYLDTTNICYSVWGTKRCGGRNPITWHDAAFYGRCGVFEACLKAAAAFTIISLFAFAIGIVCNLMIACKCLTIKTPAVLINIFGIVATSVPWAVVAGLYHNSQCRRRFRDLGSYQPGFAFFIVAWGMEIISFILICIA